MVEKESFKEDCNIVNCCIPLYGCQKTLKFKLKFSTTMDMMKANLDCRIENVAFCVLFLFIKF